MSIDILTEQSLSLTEAAKILPRRRAGKKPNVATLYRWTTAGCRGVVLESFQCGGTRCTTKEALQRFFERLTAKAAGQSSSPITTRAHEAEVQRAERTLDAAGI